MGLTKKSFSLEKTRMFALHRPWIIR